MYTTKAENKNKNIRPTKKPLYVLFGLITGISFFPLINLPPINEKLSKIQIENMMYRM
jgi:hypothetical protein